jgi:hypothetical protein
VSVIAGICHRNRFLAVNFLGKVFGKPDRRAKGPITDRTLRVPA